MLLDEIEKAHQDVYNILLQVMDHGALTDAVGKKVDFRNVILIMTTNAGAVGRPAQLHRLRPRQAPRTRTSEAIKRCSRRSSATGWTRWWRSRRLTPEVIRLVVQKFILQLEAQLADRHVTIETSDDAADWLAKNGFDELYGARPLARVIQEHIKKPLADEILFGRLIRGGHVKVDLNDGKLAFEIDADGAPDTGAAEGSTEEPALAE